MSTFALDISKFIAKANGRIDLVFQKISEDLTRSVVLKTPVDTGRARSNWNAGLNNVDPSVSPVRDVTVLERARAIISQLKGGDVYFITNNVDYIKYLEEGSSKQAPQGMVAITIRNYPGIVEKSAQEAKRERP